MHAEGLKDEKQVYVYIGFLQVLYRVILEGICVCHISLIRALHYF